MRRFRNWIFLLAFAPLPALAQTCGDFTDVSPADFYCANVEWLKNRSVTFGCTASTFCPDEPTLRGEMAAFLKRLGTKLTPAILRVQDLAVDGTYNPEIVGCVSAPFVPDYARQATFVATLWNRNATAPKIIQAGLVYSTNGGINWIGTGDLVMQHSIEVGTEKTLPLVGGPLDLEVGISYVFAIRAITLNAAPTVEGDCQLNIRIENRNPATSPL